jgi:hypothetical protein
VPQNATNVFLSEEILLLRSLVVWFCPQTRSSGKRLPVTDPVRFRKFKLKYCRAQLFLLYMSGNDKFIKRGREKEFNDKQLSSETKSNPSPEKNKYDHWSAQEYSYGSDSVWAAPRNRSIEK